MKIITKVIITIFVVLNVFSFAGAQNTNYINVNSANVESSQCFTLKNNFKLKTNNKTFKSNDKNSNGEVTRLQNFLAARGYLTGVTSNGNYGPATAKAIKSYQEANGLIVTGIVGKITRDKINYELCGDITIPITTISKEDGNKTLNTNLVDIKNINNAAAFDSIVNNKTKISLNVYQAGFNKYSEEVFSLAGFTSAYTEIATTSEILFKLEAKGLDFSKEFYTYKNELTDEKVEQKVLLPIFVFEKFCAEGFKTSGQIKSEDFVDVPLSIPAIGEFILLEKNFDLMSSLISDFPFGMPKPKKDTFSENLKNGTLYFYISDPGVRSESINQVKDFNNLKEGIYCPAIVMMKQEGVNLKVSYFSSDQKVFLKKEMLDAFWKRYKLTEPKK